MKEKIKIFSSEVEEEISERIYKIIKETKVSNTVIDKIILKEIEDNMFFSEDWQKHYAKERIKDRIKEKKPEKKKLKREDIIGFIFGISLAWFIGFRGIIPYIIGTFFGAWLTGKMLNSGKKYLKIIFWILFVTVFLLGSWSRGI
jgi:uncharacterized membrane protein